MHSLMPKLAPFWYEPEFQDDGDDPVAFQLKPLTQGEMVEIEDFYDEGRITRRAMYEAGRRAIIGYRGIADENGQSPPWRDIAERVHRHLIVVAGWRAITEATGGDWDLVMGQLRRTIDSRLTELGLSGLPESGPSLEPERVREAHEDPEKN